MTDGTGRTAFPPAPTGLGALSAIEIMAGYRRKAFTPRDVVDDTIAALQATSEACNPVVTPMYEQARAEADRLSLDEVNRGFELMEAQDGIRSVIDFA